MGWQFDASHLVVRDVVLFFGPPRGTMLTDGNSWIHDPKRNRNLTLRFVDFVCSAIIFVSFCATANPSAVPLTASVDQREGLPSLSFGGGNAMSSQFVFWGKNWAWAGLKSQFKVVAPFEYSISGRDQALNFDLSGRVTKPSNQRLVWEFNLDAAATARDVIGGGIAFRFDLTNFKSQFGEP